MKILLLLFALVGILFCAPSAMAQQPSLELKYWLHSSCKKYPLGEGKKYNLRTALDEMFRMAKTAAGRMASMKSNDSPRDVEFRRLWKMVFKTDHDDATLVQYPLEYLEFFGISERDSRATPHTTVYNTINSVAKDWEEIKDRRTSEQRIYCDNGDHFNKYDRANDLWLDTKNNVASGYNCKDTPGLRGFVACEPADDDSDDEDQPCVITVCDFAFNARNFPGYDNDRAVTIRKLADKDELTSGVRLNTYNGLSAMLLHEWTHTTPLLTEDWHLGGGDEGPTGDWQVIKELPDPQNAVINAEAMATIGILALLLEGNKNTGECFTIDRDYDTLSDTDKNNPKIMSYDDLKKSGGD